MYSKVIIIKDTHRGLYYEDGVLVQVLAAGRHSLPRRQPKQSFLAWLFRNPQVEVTLVDMRAREITIKGQEILTSDKVAIRVNILVQFSVVDARAAVRRRQLRGPALQRCQLAARVLAAMTLEKSSPIGTASAGDPARREGGGGGLRRRHCPRRRQDLVFPGNLQEIMNRVLAAERTSQAQLIEARTKAEVQHIEAQTRADAQRLESQAEADAARLQAESQAEATRLAVQAEMKALEQRSAGAQAYVSHPALLRLEELATLRELARNGNARLYLDFNGKAERETSA